MSKSTRSLFQGGRLRQAREVRQQTAAAVAERIGVTGPAITSWERNVQPRGATFTELAKVLELPEAFFLRPLSATAPEGFRFRTLSAATKRARTAAEGRAQWLHEIVEMLQDEMELPTTAVPQLDISSDPSRITDDDVEKAANETRKAWSLRDGPISDLTKLLESRGIIVGRLALNAAALDGLSAWSKDGRPYIVLNSEKASCVRSRFDAAHELGHLILHRDAPLRPDPPMYKLMEQQAHRFAGAFIFPRTAVRDEIARVDLDNLVRLKERWKLSIGSMVYRLFHNRLIDENQKAYLQRLIGARGWRTWEPLDSDLQPERPTIVRQSYQLLCEEAGWTPEDVVRRVPLAHYDHELLAGLPSRWMDSEQHRRWGELVKLRTSEGTAPAADTRERDGKVLRFPNRQGTQE